MSLEEHLISAIHTGNLPESLRLLHLGANPNFRDDLGFNILHYAVTASHNNLAVLQWAWSAGSVRGLRVEDSNCDGVSAAEMARRCGRGECVHFFNFLSSSSSSSSSAGKVDGGSAEALKEREREGEESAESDQGMGMQDNIELLLRAHNQAYTNSNVVSIAAAPAADNNGIRQHATRTRGSSGNVSSNNSNSSNGWRNERDRDRAYERERSRSQREHENEHENEYEYEQEYEHEREHERDYNLTRPKQPSNNSNSNSNNINKTVICPTIPTPSPTQTHTQLARRDPPPSKKPVQHHLTIAPSIKRPLPVHRVRTNPTASLMADDDANSTELDGSTRGSYKCGLCGLVKVHHECLYVYASDVNERHISVQTDSNYTVGFDDENSRPPSTTDVNADANVNADTEGKDAGKESDSKGKIKCEGKVMSVSRFDSCGLRISNGSSRKNKNKKNSNNNSNNNNVNKNSSNNSSNSNNDSGVGSGGGGSVSGGNGNGNGNGRKRNGEGDGFTMAP